MKDNNERSVFFDSIARTYALKEKHDYDFSFRKNALSEAKKFIKKTKHAKKRLSILEAGCGNGKLTLELLKYPEIEITAIDFSQEMLNVLKARISSYVKKRKIRRRVRILKSDITKLSFKHQFDIALLINVLVNVNDKSALAKMIKKISEALKTDGTIILSIYSINIFTRMYFSLWYNARKLLKKTGLITTYIPVVSHNPVEIKKILMENDIKIIKEIPIFLTKNPTPVNLAPSNIKNKFCAIIHGRQNIFTLIRYVFFSLFVQLDIVFKSKIGYIIVGKKE